VAVTLGEITDVNRDAVLALRVAPEQERLVGSVEDALADAAEYPHARPWYPAGFADGKPVGYQGRGYGREVVSQVADLVRAQGATKLLTSYVAQAGGPAGFYERLGFVTTGDRDGNGEIIVRLVLP
jgi:diamine N-acetyltransferase